MILNASHVLAIPALGLYTQRRNNHCSMENALNKEFSTIVKETTSFVHNIADLIFNKECEINYGNTIQIPESDDSIMFHNDIISNNGKIIANCVYLKYPVLKEMYICLGAVNTFLTTQKPFLYNLYDPNQKVNIADDFKSLLFLDKESYEIKITSPEVLWLYLDQKIKMSNTEENARKFDKLHPSRHTFNILKNTFTYEKIG